MFEKTLSDLVSGIRSSRRNTALFISQNIAEIKLELQSPDFFTKSNALQKLTFLQMMGYTMSWAAFPCVEVMSSPRFAHKRIGYLAACQGLEPDSSPVVLLTTNLLKKELRGATVGGGGENMYHAGLAINCLSNIVTQDLGQELLPDLLHLLKHPSPYIRKKTLLCLYKVFLKYPQGLRLSFDKIKFCLEDSHPSVVSCAVNVITELSDKNPKNYLPLAPAFFKLLTSSANNWMLIKVVKLLGSLVPEEPRLARKLLDPLANIVRTTHAKSLLYEAVYATTLCLCYVKKADGSQPANIEQVVELCASTLRDFVQDPDQNLKYLGLVGFGSLLQSQPNVLMSHSEHRGLILRCLSDEDVTIRTRALGLLKFMATKRNLVELISQLLSHVEAASGQYRCDLVDTMIKMCYSNKYELVIDFAWYVDVLVILAGVRGIEEQGAFIARQLMDVAWRVLPARAYSVRRSLEILVSRGDTGDDEDRFIIPDILPAVAWIVGEYSQLIPEALKSKSTSDEDGSNNVLDPIYDDSSKGPYHSLVQAMTAPTDVAGINPLPCFTNAVFVQNAMKVFAAACKRNKQTHGYQIDDFGGSSCSDEELHACASTLMKNMTIFIESPDVEVKERSFTIYQLLLSIGILPTINSTTNPVSNTAATCRNAAPTLIYLLTPEPMKPISAKAQRRKFAEAPPSPLSMEEWEEDVRWDAFWFLEEETPWFRRDGSVKGSVESISFTTQLSNNAASDSRGIGGDDQWAGQGTGQTKSGGLDASAMDLLKSQCPGGPTGSTNRREGDPFYLHSTTSPNGGLLDAPSIGSGMGLGGVSKIQKETVDVFATRFGSIQLDSGGESANEESEGVKVKKKKKKKSKKAVKTQEFPAIDMSSANSIIESDDEGDGNDQMFKPNRGEAAKHGKAHEYDNLALVDLTTPLGADEVFPRNEHYVVPERPQAENQNKTREENAKKKKRGKEKKKKTLKKDKLKTVTGDLLGFDSIAFGGGGGITADDPTVVKDVFGNRYTSSTLDDGGLSYLEASATFATVTAPMSIPSEAANHIDNAFDDLLGLEMPPMEASHAIMAFDQSNMHSEDKAQEAAKQREKKGLKTKTKKSKKEKKSKSIS